MSYAQSGAASPETGGTIFRRFTEAVWNFLALLTLTHTTLAEFQSSTTLLFMGAWFLLPGPVTSANARLVEIMPEAQWGLLFLGVGLCQSVANVFRVSYARQFAAIVATFLFATLASFGFLVRPAWPFAPAVFAAAALVQGLVFVSLSLARMYRRVNGLRHADA